MTEVPDPAALSELWIELERARKTLTNVLARALDVPVDVEELSDEAAEVAILLLDARALMLSHPVGAAATIGWLAALGRAYGATDDGRRWLDGLLVAPELEQLRLLWDAVTLNVYDRTDDVEVPPTAWVHLLADLVGDRAAVAQVVDRLNPTERS